MGGGRGAEGEGRRERGGGRGADGEGRREKGGGRGEGYEAYEVKNKRQKMRCLLLRRKKKNIIFLFMK
jgi:hypothetical protein